MAETAITIINLLPQWMARRQHHMIIYIQVQDSFEEKSWVLPTMARRQNHIFIYLIISSSDLRSDAFWDSGNEQEIQED